MDFNPSEEQKRRIEQEEAARVAEEKYREQVRRRSLPDPLAKEPESVPPSPSEVGGFQWGLPTAFALGLLLVGAWIFSSHAHHVDGITGNSESPSLLSRWEPVTIPVVHGQFQVPAQQYRSWIFVVPSENVRNYRITGHFSTIGGAGSDIQAVIATDDDFQNWINGHEANVFYSTPGKVTTGQIDVTLPPGRYTLAFSNKFSLVTTKAVFAEISTTYEQLK